MKKPVRLALTLTSLVLVFCGLLALGYALWPMANASLQYVLPSVLFTSP